MIGFKNQLISKINNMQSAVDAGRVTYNEAVNRIDSAFAYAISKNLITESEYKTICSYMVENTIF